MDKTELQNWLDSLKMGDDVGVYELYGKRFVHKTTVASRTKSGRIITVSGQVFTPLGAIYGASAPCYRDRCVRPLQA